MNGRNGFAAKGGHVFIPLCEVVHCDNDVFVTFSRGEDTLHAVNFPLEKGPTLTTRWRRYWESRVLQVKT